MVGAIGGASRRRRVCLNDRSNKIEIARPPLELRRELQAVGVRTKFFSYLFGDQRGLICIATADKTKARFKQAFYEWPNQQQEMEAFISSKIVINNVWFCVNLLNRTERKKSNCLPSQIVWADLDYSDPDKIELPPTCVVESSPGRYQAYWRLEDPIPADVAEDYSKRIAYSVGADKSGWDLTQLMRVPFTINFKYENEPEVSISRITDIFAPIAAFEELPSAEVGNNGDDSHLIPSGDMPSMDDLPDSQSVIYSHRSSLRGQEAFFVLFASEPADNADWSRMLWRLINICAEIGMTKEETFAITIEAKCNKYARDHRPMNYLWREINKAFINKTRITLVSGATMAILSMPQLVDPDTVEEDSLVKDYKKWGNVATDAPLEYHELACFIALSSLTSAGIKLDTSFGDLVPNLWGLILGESTLTRKAQNLDAKILTPNGWTTMGEVKVGDRVIGSNGKVELVLGVYPQGEQESYKVTFSDGASTECSKDHLWAIKGRGRHQKKSGIWTLEEIMQKGLRDSQGQWSRYIPLVEPVSFKEKEFIIDPYLLGLLLGDGSFGEDGSIRITSDDEEIVSYIREICPTYGLTLKQIDASNYRLSTDKMFGHSFQGHHNYLSVAIKSLGLHHHRSWEKFVPKEYLEGSIEQRLAILQGLMDTDGWIGEKKNIHFASSSKQLALDVQYLVRSLGGWSKYNGPRATEGRDSHQISISMPMNIVPFRLQRKVFRCQDRSWARPRSVRSIEYVGKKEMQCIAVSSDDGLYITDDFIVTHNTTAMRMAMDIVNDLDPGVILATDGSAEGMLSGLSLRPRRVSIFYKDEVSGFFDSINRKDYLAGLPEMLTQLYDVPKVLQRLLRKETITIAEPYFIFFGGGIRDKVYSLVNEDYIISGFIPRFLIVSGENDLARVRRTGPPTDNTWELRQKVISALGDLKVRYNTKAIIDVGGQKMEIPSRVEARLEDDAWNFYGDLEMQLILAANESGYEMMALPAFQRLAFSMLKMSILIAATRREPKDNNVLVVEKSDVVQAAFYIQKWGKHSVELIMNAGKPHVEKMIDRVYKFIKANPGVLKSQLMMRYHFSTKDIKDLTETMHDRGLIDVKKVENGTRYYSVV